MATVALTLCIVFSLWLLARDSKRHTSLSGALWIATLLVFILASRTPSGWLDIGNYSTGLTNEASGNLIDQMFFLSVIVGAFTVATMRGVSWGKLFISNLAIMAFYAYFVTSSVWSAYHVDSLVRIFKDFGATIFVVALIFSEKDPLEAVRAVYTRCACMTFPLSLAVIKFRYGDFGRVYVRGGEATFVGVTTQKNSLGEMAMVLGLFLVWDYLETPWKSLKRSWIPRQWDVLILLLMGLYLLDISESKTCLVCFLLGVALMFLKSKWLARPLFGAAMALPFLIISAEQANSIFAPLLGALGRDATFTGRTGIWQHITWSTVNPIVGAGFWNFWGGPGGMAITAAMRTPIPNAHNGYLDIFIDGGIIGLLLLFVLLMSAGLRLTRNLSANLFQRFRFAFLIVAIIGNLTESHFARPSLTWFTLILVIIDFPPLKAKEKESEEPAKQDQGMRVLEAVR